MGIERVTTGIEGLDALIEGGLIKGRSFLVAGEPGTGKTLLSLQYILDGIKKGEKGVYVSIDEKPAHLIEDAASIGWDLKKHIDNGDLQILDVSNYFSEARLGKEGKINVSTITTELNKHVKKLGAKRLVIDPIAPLISKHELLYEIQEYIRCLIFMIEELTECTTLFTSHIPVGSSKMSRYGMEEFIVSGIILLRIVKPTNKYVRTLFVRKMRSTKTDLAEYSFDITKGRGLVLRQTI